MVWLLDYILFQQHHSDALQARLIPEQNSRQGANQLMGSTRHALQDFGHIGQTIVRQMRQRTGAAVEDALHVIEY